MKLKCPTKKCKGDETDLHWQDLIQVNQKEYEAEWYCDHCGTEFVATFKLSKIKKVRTITKEEF